MFKLKMCQTFLLLLVTSSLSAGHKHVYHFINESKNCSEAEMFCREHFTDLAIMDRKTNATCMCPEAVNCTDAWVKICEKCDDDWCWLNPEEEYDEGKANWVKNDSNHRCAVVGKPDEELNWDSKSCTNSERYVCYDNQRFVDDGDHKTWVEAVESCINKKASLVSGHDQVNNKEFNDFVGQKGPHVQFWIGLYKNSGTGRFLPENILCHDSDKCGLVSGSTYNDNEDCENKHPFICFDDRVVLVKQSKTWEEALVFCRTKYGELAMMTDANLNRLIQVKADMAETDFVWVGLHFSSFFEEWMWVNGQWVTSDDSNWEMKNEQHDWNVSGAMKKKGEKKWFKMPSGKEYNFVCAIHC